tara:strand:+ start:1250 stop:2068 length:819 start_codon:yes stop_codon:yes gene_type:complete
MIYIYIIIIIVLLILVYSFYRKSEYFNIKLTPKTDNIKNRILFILWMGGELTDNRKKSIESIKKNTNCNIVLITKDNLNEYILKDYPLHKGFKYLSSIHQADYLRCYLMHHYGGGYSDLKKAKSSWEPSYKKLENDKNIWAVGLRGPNNFGLAYPEEYDKYQREKLKKNHKNLIGVSYFIYKPNTPLTQEWYNNLNKRMDYYYEDLKKHPAKYPRESKNGSPIPSWEGPTQKTKYPISWNRILGQINYPLQLKYLNHIDYGIPKPDRSKPYL